MVSPVLGNETSDAMLHQAMAYHQRGRLVEAEHLYRQLLTRSAMDPVLHTNLGLILTVQRKFDEAIEYFRAALRIAPDNVSALFSLGNLLLREGHCRERTKATPSNLAPPRSSRLEESFACFTRYAELGYAAATPAQRTHAHKARHDQEQYQYLRDRGIDGNLQFHLGDGSRVKSRAVNPADIQCITTQWLERRPQSVTVDDLLSIEALEKLRGFCWDSTIWRIDHPEGYLMATPEHGFACPLLAQIDEELRAMYPAIFQDYILRSLWAFKYDSELSGVGTHADPSAITVNFWITSDQANLDPECGRLDCLG